MKYYKYIDVENFDLIKEKTLLFLENPDVKKTLVYGFTLLNWKEYTEFFPDIINSFHKYNIHPVKAALYITKKLEHSRIHVDYKNEKMHLCRINIPIKNCKGSKTEFYSGGNFYEVSQINGLKYLEIIENDTTAIKMDEVEIIRPTVIRIQEPHRVITNEECVPRICMTLFMNVDPVFLLEE